jgi:hypothetical protein
MRIHHAVPAAAWGNDPEHSGRVQKRGPDSTAAWRRRLLLSAGFPDSLARQVAETHGVDIHALLNLVDRGCPPELAVRILGPLADPRQG